MADSSYSSDIQNTSRPTPLWTLLITAFLCVTVTFGLYSGVHKWQHERIGAELDRTAFTYRALFQDKIRSYFNQIDALQRFFGGSDVVDRSEFSAFVGPVLEKNSAIKSFLWLPKALPDLRTNLEEAPAPSILQGLLPITYIEPMPAGRPSIGVDLSTDPASGDIFSALAKSGEPSIIANIGNFHGLADLFDDNTHLSLIIQPVYDRMSRDISITPNERAQHLRGFLILVFDVALSFEQSIASTIAGGIDIDLIDVQPGTGAALLYTHLSRSTGEASKLLAAYMKRLSVERTVPLSVQSVEWSLAFTPVSTFYQRHYHWLAEYMLGLGLILTAGILFLTHSNRRRFSQIEDVVQSRTESLIASENEKISTLESINDIFFRLDADWNFRYLNPKAESLFGKADFDLHGKGLWDEYPDFRSFFYLPLYHALKNQHTVQVRQLRFPTKNLWFSLKVVPKPQGLSVYLCDITEQVKERQHREQAEHHTQAILETAVDGIITINAHGSIRSMNPAAEAIFGYRVDQVKGRNIKLLMPEPYHSEHDGYLDNHIRTGEKKIIGIGREVTGLRANGETFPMDLAVSEMKLGGHRHFVGIVRDISDRRQAEEQIRQSQKMDALGKLAGGVAHEFNNILVGIMGFASLAQEASNDEDLVDMSLKEISTASHRAAALTQELLTFSRKKVARTEVANVGDMIHDVTNFLGTLIGSTIQLEVEISTDDAKIEVDAGQFSQVITNLVVNARDAMDSGGKIYISTRTLDNSFLLPFRPSDQPDLSYACVSVRDTGSGMDADTKKQLFEPFFTTKETGIGTGLGLSMVYGFIEQSGGVIEVESEIGVGTIFNLYFPVSNKDLSEAHEDGADTPFVWDKHMTVMVVDDEEMVRKFATAVLSDAGLTVLTACDGREALGLWQQHKGKIDVVLTDIMMPELSGPEMVERIREEEPSTKVVFISGFPGQSESLPEDLYTTSNFLEKPFTKSALLGVMAQAMLKD